MWILVIQRMVLELVLDLVYFPLWWYTAGTKKAAITCYHLLQDGNMRMAPGLWLKNIFAPMYGQTDWRGRLTSFFVRSANIVLRGFALLVWLIVVVMIFLLWLVFPVFVVYMLFQSIA